MLRLYDELAVWWPLFCSTGDYEVEAGHLGRLLSEAYPHRPATLLELGSGGGSNAFHLKKLFSSVTLVDLSPRMLAVSQTYNPDCEHLQGDMRTVRLGRAFNVVFVHDAIMYMTTLDDLRQVVETAYVHCQPGGMAMFVPDHVRETFQPMVYTGGKDGDGRGLRYLEWYVAPNGSDATYTVDFVFMLREGSQPVRVEHERHEFGLFAEAEWVRLLTETGFRPDVVTDPYGRHIFMAHKPKR